MTKRTIFAVVALVVAAGCAPTGKERPRVTYITADAPAILAAYNDNAAAVPTLSATLDMTLHYTEDSRDKKHTLDAWLDVEKPARIRLKHDTLGRDLFYVVADGENYWIGLDRAIAGGEDTVYTGSLAALENESLFRPDRLLAAFSLAALPPVGTDETLFESYSDRYILTFIDKSSPPKVLGRATFSRVDLRLSKFQVFDEKSRLTLEVDYLLYQTAGDARLPEAVFINWPLDGFSISAKVKKPKVGAALPARLWEFKWRKDACLIDLDSVVLETVDAPRE